MANSIIKISGSHTKQNIRDAVANGDKTSAGKFLRSVSKALMDNANCELQILNDDGVAASATITFSGVGAANDTVVVNGATFTGKASGATGDQYNVGASATSSASALAAAVNGSVTAAVNAFVKASSAAGVCTITALNTGVAGNTITLAKGVDGGSVMTVSTARLASGADDTSTSIGFKNW